NEGHVLAILEGFKNRLPARPIQKDGHLILPGFKKPAKSVGTIEAELVDRGSFRIRAGIRSGSPFALDSCDIGFACCKCWVFRADLEIRPFVGKQQRAFPVDHGNAVDFSFPETAKHGQSFLDWRAEDTIRKAGMEPPASFGVRQGVYESLGACRCAEQNRPCEQQNREQPLDVAHFKRKIARSAAASNSGGGRPS